MNNLVSLDLSKTLQSFKVTRKQSDDVGVQRRLDCWLEPGWCMTAPAGSEAKMKRKSRLMLWWIAGVMTLLGLVGLVTSYPIEGLFTIALVLVIVIALGSLILSKMPAVLKGKK